MRDEDMMRDEEILARLTAIVREVIDDPAIVLSTDTCAGDVAGWDSMNHIAIVVEAECRFGVDFAMEELAALRRVGVLLRRIAQRRRDHPPDLATAA